MQLDAALPMEHSTLPVNMDGKEFLEAETPTSVGISEPRAWGRLAGEQLAKELLVLGASASRSEMLKKATPSELVERTHDCYTEGLLRAAPYHMNRCIIL